MVLALGALWTLSLAGLFAAAITDFRHRIIPNRLVWLTAGCGIAMRLLTEPRSLGLSIGAAAAILLALGVLAHRQVIGGGDAKLIAAATLLVAPHEIGGLLLIIALGGGFISAIYLLAHLASRRASFAKITGDCTSAGLSPRERLTPRDGRGDRQREIHPVWLGDLCGNRRSCT